MKKFFKRFFCKHGPWRILSIGWDGETTVECQKCGKIKRKGL